MSRLEFGFGGFGSLPALCEWGFAEINYINSRHTPYTLPEYTAAEAFTSGRRLFAMLDSPTSPLLRLPDRPSDRPTPQATPYPLHVPSPNYPPYRVSTRSRSYELPRSVQYLPSRAELTPALTQVRRSPLRRLRSKVHPPEILHGRAPPACQVADHAVGVAWRV